MVESNSAEINVTRKSALFLPYQIWHVFYLFDYFFSYMCCISYQLLKPYYNLSNEAIVYSKMGHFQIRSWNVNKNNVSWRKKAVQKHAQECTTSVMYLGHPYVIMKHHWQFGLHLAATKCSNAIIFWGISCSVCGTIMVTFSKIHVPDGI